jgi:hypothetical protein
VIKYNDNYDFTYGITAALAITPATLTIIPADYIGLPFDSPVPDPYLLTISGYMNGDTEASVIATMPEATSPYYVGAGPASYTITASGAALKAGNANYTFSYLTGTLTVGARPATPPPTDGTLYTVTYLPGTFGTFGAQVYGGLSLGSITPVFAGTPTGQTGYTFNGWAPVVSPTVRGNATYVAQWIAPAVVVEGETPTAIEEEPSPQAAPDEQIMSESVPLANIASWALLNLMLTIVTGLTMVALLATYFLRRKEEEEEKEEDSDSEKKINKHLIARLITIAATVIAIILFVVTQNMELPMILADKYTIWHVIIVAATVVLAFISKKNYEDEELAEDRI